MSASWAKWGWGLIVLAVSLGAAWEIWADRAEDAAEKTKPDVAVETLLPADTVFTPGMMGRNSTRPPGSIPPPTKRSPPRVWMSY